jgi:hypothetical protein
MKRLILTFLALFVFALFPIYAGAQTKHFQKDTNGTLTTSLVSYYKLEDATDFFDSNNLTNTGVTFSAAKVNNGATNFDGSSAIYLNKTNATGLPSGSGAWSVNLWVYPNSLSHNGCAFSFGATGPTAGIRVMMYILSANNHFFFSGYNADLDSGIALSNATWSMITATFDGTTLRTYVNGTAGATGTPAMNLSGTNIVVGNTPDLGASELWKGGVDEAAIWTKALSTTEIADLYNGGAGQTMISTAATAETAAMPLFTVPTSTASTFLANVSQTFTDSGLLSIITVAIGLPSAFWLIKQVMGLIPKK